MGGVHAVTWGTPAHLAVRIVMWLDAMRG
jgi:hypothetical protein